MKLGEMIATMQCIARCETPEEVAGLCKRIAVDLSRYGCTPTMRYILRMAATQQYAELRLETDLEEEVEDDWGEV